MEPKPEEIGGFTQRDVSLFYSPFDSEIQVITIKIPCEYYKKLYELAKIYDVTISHLIRVGIFYTIGVYEAPYKPAKGIRKYELTSDPDECEKVKVITSKLSNYTLHLLDRISMNMHISRAELLRNAIDVIYERHKQGKLVILPAYYGV